MANTLILIIGGGGREHALACALASGDRQIVVSPGNAGIAQEFECIQPEAKGVKGWVSLAQKLNPSLVVVGPEQPLVDGLVDQLEAIGIPALGPHAQAAQIEGSKVFMKNLCVEAGVDTAAYGAIQEYDELSPFFKEHQATESSRWVVKADGLCAGKGVTICESLSHTRDVAKDFLGVATDEANPLFGEASQQIIVEEFIDGVEVSILGLCDGDDALLFAPARDHKQLYDGGQGPNTGGMGAVAPLGAQEGITDEFLESVRQTIFRPILDALKKRGTPYRGILYAGLMLQPHRTAVLEFNCRFGDPEAQAVLMGTHEDLYPLFLAIAKGEKLPAERPNLIEACRPTATVVLASEGYPSRAITGVPIQTDGHIQKEFEKIFYAGVSHSGDGLLTSGGRVLACTASADSHAMAIERAYQLLTHIEFKGSQHRRDIGASLLKPQE